MRQALSCFFVFLLAGCSTLQAESSAVALARVLAAKGLISRADLATVESASADDAVRVLTRVLTERGVLTTEEAAAVLPGSGSAEPKPVLADAKIVPAVYQPPALPAQTVRQSPSAGPATSAPPVVTSQSKLPVTLYGTILVNGFFNTAATNNQDIPLTLLKQGSDTLGNDKSFGMTARQSRFGLRFQGGQVASAKLSGQFEFDLAGGKAAYPNGEAFDLFRLRLAYGRLDWDHWSLIGGQDWSVFAPLNPASYAGYAIPLFAGAGNPWIRTPQIRVDYKQKAGSDATILFQLAGTDPNVGDQPTTSFISLRQPLAGERGRMPAIDSRFAVQGKIGGRDAAIGISGHYGRGKNSGTLANNTVRQVGFDSWGGAFDYALPFAKKFTLTGELYAGRALGIYSVGLGESDTPVGNPGERGVLSRGGWTQAQFFLTPKVQLNLGYGIDAQDLKTIRVGDRGKNQSYDGSIFYKLTPSFTLAWEYRRLLSDYRNQLFANERGDNVNLGLAFSF